MSDGNETTDPIVGLLRRRRLDQEDFQIQLEEALASYKRGYYATSRAELHGAILILDQIERRRNG